MKKYINAILMVYLIIGLVKLHAQPLCEFDTVYTPNSFINLNSGRKVIQLNDKNFFIVGTTIELTNTPPDYFYSTSFAKIGACGGIMGTFKDSVSLNYIADTKLIEEQGASITILINGNRLIKLDRYMNKKWEVKLGDAVNYISTNSFIKLSNNKYLFVGKKARACILMTDTLGNAILQKRLSIDSNSNSYFQKVYKKSLNEINLLGFEDSSLIILTIDTIGNIQNSYKTVLFNGSSTYKHVCFNYDSTEIIYSSLVSSAHKIYLARYTSSGVKIKDTMTSIDGIANINESNLSVAPNKTIELLALYCTLLIDKDFNIIWKDTLLLRKPYEDYAYHSSIFTKENSVITIGDRVHCPGISGTCYWDLHIKKSFTYKYVKSLTISGQNYINTNGGQTQLTPIITPADALNKKIYWNVSDWSKAIIDSNGLLTAKANGIVKVTATSADNSLATAFMNITISNQSIGIDEALSKSFASVYPNPSSQIINISFQSSVTNPEFELYDTKECLLKMFILIK
ncbi:MAG: Ig-like domain-containing protein [Bacteroidota bacterium]|nr:Ig-like domain-containing protein [Bacteroidota bacterium]